MPKWRGAGGSDGRPESRFDFTDKSLDLKDRNSIFASSLTALKVIVRFAGVLIFAGFW